MTKKQRDVIERARRKPARIIEIDPREGRVYRETAYENHFGPLFPRNPTVTELLEAEQRRLIETWNKEGGE